MFLDLFTFCRTKSSQRGFSLIELSVVISVAAASTVAFLSWTQPETLTDAQNAIETRKRIDKIEKAIEAFRVERDKLPCPADPRMRIDNTHALGINQVIGTGGDTYGNDFGTEDLDETQETSGTVTLGIDCPNTMGAVPVQSLGLSNDYINDAWGRRFTYTISPNICSTDAGFPHPGTAAQQTASSEEGCTRNDYENNSGDIVITDGTNPYTTAAAYVIISHGANGIGAFLPSGEQLAGATGDELENSDGIEGSGTYDGKYVFIKRAKNNTYDDITSFKTKVQIERLTTRSNAKQISVEACDENSEIIKGIRGNEADFMSANITGYDHTTGIYNTGEQVGLGLMMAVQDICISYYGYKPTQIRGETWNGAQCPGNNYTDDGTENTYARNTTYSSKNNVCTCEDDNWDGNCVMDWFAASGLTGLSVDNDRLILWLDADSPETIFSDSTCETLAVHGQGVGCWRDKSTYQFEAVQGNASRRPTYQVSSTMNSNDVLDFPGTGGTKLSIPSDPLLNITGDMSILFAINFDDFGQWNGILAKSVENRSAPYDLYAVINSDPSSFRLFKGNGVSQSFVSSDINLDNDSDHVFSVITTGTTVNYFKNGTENGDGNHTQPVVGGDTHLDIGGRNDDVTRLDGEFGELLMYDVALTPADHNVVKNYLSDKWEISTIPILATLSDEPVLWLDADDEGTLFQSNCTTNITSGTLGCWKNKSRIGAANDAIQTNAARQPSFIKEASVNYRNVILFDGNDFMEANGAASEFNSDHTVFIVADTTDGVSTRDTFLGLNDNTASGGQQNVLLLMREDTTNLTFYAQNSRNDIIDTFSVNDPAFVFSATSTNAAPPTPAVITSYYNGVNTNVSVNYTYTTPGTADTLVIGAEYDGSAPGDYLDGFVAEIIAYDKLLSDANRQAIENYLSDKWDIEIDN